MPVALPSAQSNPIRIRDSAHGTTGDAAGEGVRRDVARHYATRANDGALANGHAAHHGDVRGKPRATAHVKAALRSVTCATWSRSSRVMTRSSGCSG